MLPHNQGCGVPSNGVEVAKFTRLKPDSELDSCFRFDAVEAIIVFIDFALRYIWPPRLWSWRRLL